MRWSDRVEEALGTPGWRSDEATVVLDLAREVAHNTERAFAPLTAYMLGVAVGQSLAGGDERDRAVLCEEYGEALFEAVRASADDAGS